MADEPERVWIGLRGVNTYKADHFDTEYLRADLIDMDVLRRVEAALKDSFGISRAQERISKAALTDLRAMMEKINE